MNKCEMKQLTYTELGLDLQTLSCSRSRPDRPIFTRTCSDNSARVFTGLQAQGGAAMLPDHFPHKNYFNYPIKGDFTRYEIFNISLFDLVTKLSCQIFQIQLSVALVWGHRL